jgi:hypothetical protein
MKLSTLGILGAVVVGMFAMGCSPKSQGQAKAPRLDSWEQMMDRNGDVASTTTLTNATIKNEPKKLLIPYVNFDEYDGDSADESENLVIQTWGAPYQAYEGYDEKLGF